TGTITLVAGQVYSLEQVYYTIPANTPIGIYPLYFDTNNPGNSLQNDPSADFVNLVSNTNLTSYQSPGNTIDGAFVWVPEPSSYCLMSLAVVGMLLMRRKLARRA
ncbi:MAG TPA: PEP-CTERM sorting domain-containing protein, partial [Pirellulales bacterium]|nr:PEP-CTERM sorting domain-containing protein [Pirellulales bacterium]